VDTVDRSTRIRGALKRSIAARVLLLPRRYRAARAADTWSRGQVIRWLATSREYTNFTYELTPANRLELHSFVARVLGVDPQRVSEAIAELQGDEALARHIADVTGRSPFRHVADQAAHYGRRAGWYALVRLIKPAVVVESGVDKGLGACVVASALLRNSEEGAGGRYLGLDVDRSAGWLLTGPYAQVATVRYGDSITLLGQLEEVVDVFIHDSDHTPSYERAEYLAVSQKVSNDAVLLSDNAHVTDELHRFAIATGRNFDFWREEPEHWYPGGGIGAAWRAGP
jgi:hypothetical protein